MKKILSFVGLCLLTSTMFGCVNEGTSITLWGVAEPGACTAGDGGEVLVTGGADDIVQDYVAHLNIVNNMSEESAWSSASSSSSSGSTFEPTLPSMNTVYLEKAKLTCISIDDSEDGCNGKDDVDVDLGSYPVRAGGATLIPAKFPVKNWSFNTSITMGIQVKYHDSGVWKSGISNTITFSIVRTGSSFDDYVKENHCKKFKANTACAVYGQDSPANESAWTCEEEEEGGDGGGGEE